MRAVKKVIDTIFSINEVICKILLCIIFSVMWIVVFGRYFFSYTPIWSEDLILFSMCWLVMLSGAEAFRRDAHLKITVFQNMLPENVRNKLKVVIDIITCIFFAYMVKVGWEQVVANFTVYYTGMKISKLWVFLCFPLSFALTVAAKADIYITKYLNKQEEQTA